VHFNLIDAAICDVVKHFEYMESIGTERLTINSQEAYLVTFLHNLRELSIFERYTKNIYLKSHIHSSSYPTSLEMLNIHSEPLCKLSLHLDLDNVPNLKSVKITQGDEYAIALSVYASQTPQNLSSLELQVHNMVIDRDSAERIMVAPKFTDFNVRVEWGDKKFNKVFDGLSAPNLRYFSSTGSQHWPHDYDLDAPQLRRIDHYNHGCLPKSAAKYAHLTNIYTEHSNPNQYTHLSQLTEMTMMVNDAPITELPANLKKLKIRDWNWGDVYMRFLPNNLEVLDTSEISLILFLMCKIPETIHTWLMPNGSPERVKSIPKEWKNMQGREVHDNRVVRPPRAIQRWTKDRVGITYILKTRKVTVQ
jgi:hypothetical protein